MNDKACALCILLLSALLVACFWQQRALTCRLEALSASLRHEIEKDDESTMKGMKPLTEAPRGLKWGMGGNGCTGSGCPLKGEGAKDVLP